MTIAAVSNLHHCTSGGGGERGFSGYEQGRGPMERFDGISFIGKSTPLAC